MRPAADANGILHWLLGVGMEIAGSLEGDVASGSGREEAALRCMILLQATLGPSWKWYM